MQLIDDLPDDVVGVRAVGEVEVSPYDQLDRARSRITT